MLSLLIFLFSPPPGCSPPVLAYRSGSESCWVQFQTPSKKLCIDHHSWIRWLKTPEPGWICENPLIPSKVYTYLSNSPDEESPSKSLHFIQTRPQVGHQKPRSYLLKFLFKFLQKTEQIREKFSYTLSNHDPFGIFRSLILNEKGGKDFLSLLRILGFVHLSSATGIHIYAALKAWNRTLFFLCQVFSIPIRIGIRIGYWSGFLLSLILWLLSGARMGMLRPALVIGLKNLALLCGFRWARFTPLILVLVLELIFHSEEYSGRWIYALAVGGGLYWCDSFKSVHLGLAIGSWISVAIWEAWEAGSISLATPILSLTTLPIYCSFLYPVLVALLFGNLFHPLGQFLCNLVHPLNHLLFQLSMHEGNLWIVPRWAILLGLGLSGVWVFFLKNLSKKIKLSLIIFVLIFYMTQFKWNRTRILKIEHTAKKVEQLDVGQGDSALVVSDHHIGLIDTGSAHSMREAAWFKLFSQRQITRINWIGLTHLDEDHVGGLLSLARLIPIDCVATSRQELQSPRGILLQKKLRTFRVPLQDWEAGCVPYPTYSPPILSHARKTRNQNMSAIWIPLGKKGFYLSAGDADVTQEKKMGLWAAHLSQNLTGLRILKISHHGSRFSTSEEWLQLIRPTQAWISVGLGNRYGHPTHATLERLKKAKITVLRTDLDGVIAAGKEK